MTHTLRTAANDSPGIKAGSGTVSERGARVDSLNFVWEEVEGLCAKYEDHLEEVRGCAAGVSSAAETAGLFVERHTSVVCPACLKVCCINRHSYHDLTDIISICALGEKPAFYMRGAGDKKPCQFLGERGCSIKRPLRPHRCNWYFCVPLLEHIETVPAREYRRFIAQLRDINKKREGLVTAFAGVMKQAGYDFGHLRRTSDEFFFT